MNSLINYFKDSYLELRLVTWPKRHQVVVDSLMVIIISLIFAVLLGALDLGLSFILQLLLNVA